MKTEIITPDNEAHWLELRKADITSTMMPALFGLSPYVTRFELWHGKKNGLYLPFESNGRVEKGSRMEGYALQEIAIKEGCEVVAFKDYVRLPEHRIGSSFDGIAHTKNGKRIAEIKALDYFRHKEGWREDEIPADKEIQIRHQLMCAPDDVVGADIYAFTSIYDYHKYSFERDEAFERGLLDEAARFWHTVDNGIEPEPDYYRDGDMIDLIYGATDDEFEDRTGDNDLADIIKSFEMNRELEAYHKAEKEAAKKKAHMMLKTSKGAWLNDAKVDAGWTRGSPGTVVTLDMVGQIIGARAGYRKLNVKRLEREE